MILFISKIGASLPIIYRMRQENIDAKIYVHKEQYRSCYDGIIDKVALNDLKKEMDRAEKIIFDSDFDINIPGTNDKSICRPFKIDEEDVRQEIGVKTNDKVTGIKFTAEMWFDGKEPVLFTHCLPSPNLFTGNLGRLASSQTNCLWIAKEDSLLIDRLKKVIPLLKKESYVGPVSIDCIIDLRKKSYYFEKFHVGLRYDNIFCLLSLQHDFLSSFINGNIPESNKKFSCSERVTIAPYPYRFKSSLEEIAKGVSIKTSLGNGFYGQDITDTEDGLQCAGNDGVLGIMTATGRSVEAGFSKVYMAIRKLKVGAPLQHRIDGILETKKKLKKLSHNWNIN